jgi:hypothetical protein
MSSLTIHSLNNVIYKHGESGGVAELAKASIADPRDTVSNIGSNRIRVQILSQTENIFLFCLCHI